MILAHTIVGVTAGNYFGCVWYIVAWSIIPDIDHAYILLKNKFYTWHKIVDSIRFEERYKINYKTRYVHSVFGALIITLPLAFFSTRGAFYFFLAYIFHLVIDWLDCDEKQFLFPLKIKFKGFLPIFSKTEIVVTLCLSIFMVYSFVK
jgi:hypothetical protein